MTAKREPFFGGAVPRIRAPMSSGFMPTGIEAGAPSVHHIIVDTMPGWGYFALVAGASISTLATPASSWPVTTRRMGGWSVEMFASSRYAAQ